MGFSVGTRPYLTCTVSPAAIAATKELAARNGISVSTQVELLIRHAASLGDGA